MNQNENQTPEIQVFEEKVEQLRQCLEKNENSMGNKLEFLKYENFWFPTSRLKCILHYQAHFQARDSDIILANVPKTGTTWLSALLFSIVNRKDPDHQPLKKKSPLLSHNPHELVYFLDGGVYGGDAHHPSPQQLQELTSLRLLHTHVPYMSLPESIKNSSSCKIVYIARNPLDTFVSQWHWYVDVLPKMVATPAGTTEFQPLSMEVFFEDFCHGIFPYGPYFDHVLGFWKQSLEQPNKVLFLKYEDLKKGQAVVHLKKLAEFVGFPFSHEEESQGFIKDIMELCSIKNLKELEVNKSGSMYNFVENKTFFRKGEVGDWANYFTPYMVERINLLMQEKLDGTGLSFDLHAHSE